MKKMHRKCDWAPILSTDEIGRMCELRRRKAGCEENGEKHIEWERERVRGADASIEEGLRDCSKRLVPVLIKNYTRKSIAINLYTSLASTLDSAPPFATPFPTPWKARTYIISAVQPLCTTKHRKLFQTNSSES